MANALLPAEWKKVLKDHKDAPDTTDVTKALDAYAKAETKAKDVPQPVLDALGELVNAAKSARSANLKDKARKPVVDFLDDVLKDAATMKVKVERLLQEKNERDRAGEDDDEGGNDERAKLTAQLIKVKKLDAGAAKGFALALGGKAHGLVISKTPSVSGDHKKRARAMRDGNGKIFTGLVYGESGKYVFQLEEKPPNGLAKAIKKTASMHTDLKSIRVTLRGPEGFELDDETDAEEMADLGADTGDGVADPGAAGLASEWSAKLAQWSPAIKAALAAKGPNAAAVAKLLAQATSLSKPGGDTAEAIARLTECHALATSEAPPGAGGNGDAADPEAVAFKARIDALTPRLKDGLKQGGDLKQGLTLTFSQAQVAARKKDYAGAAGLLDEVERLLGQVTATPTDAPVEPTPGGMDAFKLRLNALKVRYDRVKDLPAGAGAKAAFVEAVKAVAAGNAGPATDALDALEVRLTTAERSAGAAAEVGEGGDDVVAYRSALLKWQTCRAGVRDSVETLITAVLDDPETQDLDPEDRDEVAAAIPTIREEVAAFDNKLDDAVNGYINAPAAKKRGAMKGIRKAINAYRSALDNPILAAMADSGYGDYPVVTEIESALQEFEGLLVRPVTV